MGFGLRWCEWMEALIFNSSMSILGAGSSTEDFKVSRGLRQGDHISPFGGRKSFLVYCSKLCL